MIISLVLRLGKNSKVLISMRWATLKTAVKRWEDPATLQNSTLLTRRKRKANHSIKTFWTEKTQNALIQNRWISRQNTTGRINSRPSQTT